MRRSSHGLAAAAALGMVVLAALAPARASDAQAAAELGRMTEAARTANYRGVVVYRSGEVLQTLRVVHAFQNGVVRERLVSQTGEAREILRNGDEVICILPQERKVTIDRRGPTSRKTGLFPPLPPETVRALSSHYRFAALGADRIAGRPCSGVRIEPLDEYRYGYEFWIDQATRVPLKVSLVDGKGDVLEELMFTEVQFPAAIAAAELQTGIDTRTFQQVVQSISEDGEASTLTVQDLPPGYRLLMADRRQVPGERSGVMHLLYSDGLSVVSVYGTPRPASPRLFQGVSHMGAVHAFGVLVGGQHVTVVGEVPEATVQRIGKGVRATEDLPPAAAVAPGR